MARVHPSAEVSSEAIIGDDVVIWNQAQVREHAVIGHQSSIGKNVYIDFGVRVGARCKIQNNVSVFHGVTVEDGVFIGPHVCFTNDRVPRAINPDGSQKDADDWVVEPTVVEHGASIGAASVILPGVRLGRFCLVGSGSVVTHDVPAHGLVFGSPARLVGWVCACGARLLESVRSTDSDQTLACSRCGLGISLESSDTWNRFRSST